ncbi:MAG TPA: hypothetical protein VEW06_06475 [Xanthobacteraceae bacterium]|nr:hypothetical protein [Xanthobacteraceae bacterium]
MPAANPLRGEVGFTACGQERILRFGVNEICGLEDELGLSFQEIIARCVENPTMNVIRTVFRRAVVGAEISAEEAGAMIDELTIAHAVELLVTSHTRATPEPKDTNGSRPPKPARVPAIGKATSVTGSP